MAFLFVMRHSLDTELLLLGRLGYNIDYHQQLII